jgi:hypothetical protein
MVMTVSGQKRKCPGFRGASVLPSGADIVSPPGMSVWCHEAVDHEFPLKPDPDRFGQTCIQGRPIRIQVQQLFVTKFKIKLHLQQWARASAAPRAPRKQLVH